jgi:hypothetical protein
MNVRTNAWKRVARLLLHVAVDEAGKGSDLVARVYPDVDVECWRHEQTLSVRLTNARTSA